MFAMLHGAWPISGDAEAGDARSTLERAVAAQLGAGFDLITDGGVHRDTDGDGLEAVGEGRLVAAWLETVDAVRGHAGRDDAVDRAAATQPAVAATITGPFTLGVRAGAPATAAEIGRRLAVEIEALADAGCPMVIVDEPAAIGIGADVDRRRSFRHAQASLLGDSPRVHAMLAISGGSAWEAGAETILEAPYASYLLDVIAGPDNWYLARAIPGDRGIVCGALRAPSLADQASVLVWAANYAASMNGRGLERVGLANASRLEQLHETDAVAALVALARASRLAAMDPDSAIAAGLDRRTFGQPPERGARPRLPRA